MNLKVRLDRQKSDPVYSLPTSLIEKGRNDRFGRVSWLGETSTRLGVASAYVAKYEEALKTLAREFSRVKENERQKIAEHLHDEFGQDLLVVKMRLAELMISLPPQYRGCAEGISEIISSLICHTRTVIADLCPRYVCETGLRSALQSLTEELQRKYGLVCTARLDSIPRRLKDEVQQILFRAVRELLFNVVKHAQASKVEIVVTRKLGSIAIEVCDDGRGFDHRQTGVSDLSIGRFGLFSVRADLAPLGGELRIFSSLGKGTRAIITLPIDAA
jgi:two-component system, NarL family, sensor histidine kinase UhpB